MKNKKWQRYIFLAIALVAAIWFGKYQYTEWKIERDEKIRVAKEHEEMDRLLNQMALKYNAITEWPDRIPGKKRNPYSIELENLMIHEGRPILLYAEIYDIVNHNNKFIVHFRTNSLYKAATQVVFILECNLNQIKTIKEADSKFKGKHAYFAIIAQVSEIQKKEYQEYRDPWTGYVISGRCLDLLFVSSYYYYKNHYYRKWGKHE